MHVFVYGTLRPGGRFHDTGFEDDAVAVTGPVRLSGLALHEGPGWPLTVANPDATVVGEVITVAESAAAKVLERLDAIEGAPILFERHLLASPVALMRSTPPLTTPLPRAPEGVTTGDPLGLTVGVWLYVATLSTIRDHAGPQIPSGDWFDLDPAAREAWERTLGRRYEAPAVQAPN
jgi:gamma-glutamylcyclotransferase (GGCT)/AIG2-like uncharacterized protein YtfP